MPERIPQSTAILIPLYAVLSSDHITPATGKTIAITISVNGAAFGNPSGGATNATEIGNGWYYFSASTTDTGTLGPLIVHGAVATIDNVDIAYSVVSATSGGYTNLDATVSSRLASASYTAPSNLTAAQIATGIWQDTTSGDFTVSSSIGKSLYTAGVVPGGATGLFITSSYTTPPTAVQNADALLDRADGIEVGLTPRQALRLDSAALAGKLSGGATVTNTFRNAVADSKDRIVATVDSSGNRTAITYDVS